LPELDDQVRQTLSEAQRLGFIGAGPLEPHVSRSHGFAAAFGPSAPARLVDLGTGGGLPGLVLAGAWPTTAVRLLDANQRRCAFLRRAVRDLGWEERVVVDERRAEQAGRDPGVRAGADAVVARSFAPPAVTAECGSPLLRPGGLLIVGEPPDGGPSRWPARSLAELGLAVDDLQVPGFVRLRQVGQCPGRFPRRVGVPAKRPLF
jgi:16S rRNA (guanine527-N7)-methyltransferase